jgi:hypothetical protein
MECCHDNEMLPTIGYDLINWYYLLSTFVHGLDNKGYTPGFAVFGTGSKPGLEFGESCWDQN